jgi:two-component system sensor histidine kinase PilS (NtrC family)
VSKFAADAVVRLGGPPAPPPTVLTATVPDSFWTSLRYFNLYRIGLALIFIASAFVYGERLGLGRHNFQMYTAISAAYLGFAGLFHLALVRLRRGFEIHLTLHVCTDIVAIVALMYASGGFRSGLAVMLLISIAAASLVGRGRLLLAYAALAAIAVLIEQTVWVVGHGESTSSFVPSGLLSIGYFATALITSQLAGRVITNERVARQRGIDLANQLRLNQLVIQDVQDGVLVIDANERVRSHNPRVGKLLGRSATELEEIETYAADLADALAEWREGRGKSTTALVIPDTGAHVRVRFVEAGMEGDSLTVAYLEDLSELEAGARQLKLAALGRLTANIAHEIRNPLAAITHAIELMQEENRQPARERLMRIVRDNARRLERMVQDVLELNRRDRLQAEPIQLSRFVASFLDEFAQNEHVERATFEIERSGDGVVEFDRVHLNQVLWNLARNAWRHSRQASGSVRLRLLRQGVRLELHVIDDGPGVPKDLKGQLFEPFFTTYSAGTGLGLYIARELCAANGATLDYIDRPGGADFRVSWQGGRNEPT